MQNMNQVQQERETTHRKTVSVLLQDSDEGSTYTWSGEATSYDDAVVQARADALEAIGEYPELDVVLSVTEGDAVYINEGTVFGPPERDVVCLFKYGYDMSNPGSPDVVVEIDMNRVRKAFEICRQYRDSIDSVNAQASVIFGNNETFDAQRAYIEITHGATGFGMLRIADKYSDAIISRGVYFDEPSLDDWKRAWIDGDTVYVVDQKAMKVEMRQIDENGCFATDENDAIPVRHASVLSSDLAKKLYIDNPAAYGVTIEGAPAIRRAKVKP